MIQTDNNIPNGNNEKPYRYVFQAGHGEDIINSKTNNNKNNQNIEIVFEKAQADDAIFLQAGNDLVIQAFNNQDSVTLTDFLDPDKTNICTVTIIFDDKTLSSEDIADTITTLNNSSKNDECTDSDSNNNINKKTSDDRQYSQNSNDSLNDIASYSTLIGNSGNHILKGSDWQKDRYEYEAGHGQDVIYDQGNTSDQSQFSDVVFKEANLADAQFTRSGTDLVICAYGEDDSLTLPDYFNNSYSRAFNFIFDDKVLNVDDIAAMSFTLGGTSGDDVLRGWNSHDIIAGGPGNDKLYGGDGIDNLFGGAGNDELYGENDNDYLSGGDGDDYLDGGNGYDILIGGSGNDTLKGGDWEKDRYEFTAGHGQDVIYDQGNAGDQNQRNDIVFKGANFTDALFHRSGNNLIIKAYGNSDFVALSDYFNNDYSRAFNFIFEDQTIGAPDINNKITVTLNGDDNDNKITGHWGNDLINGGAGNDELYGNGGDDTLIGGTGNDYMEGGQGNDTYVFAKGHGQDTIYDTEGADTIQFTDVDFAEVKFRKNNYDLIIYGYNDNDSVLIQNFFYSDSYTIENFVFKDKTVTLAQLRKDGMQLYGTSGNDSISITTGRVLVYGDDGNDNITTGSSNDVLDGGAGNDNLYGNAGNDTLIGGTGNDYLAGGYGNDTYVFAKGHGQDTIYDTEGADTIQFTDVDFAEVKFRKNNYDLIIYGYNDNDSVLIQNFFYSDSYTIENFVFKDKTVTLAQLRKDGMQLYGTSGNDSISITTGRVLVYGDDGNDTITTGSGNDVLDGGAGNDNLYGNAGNDTLIGGTGNDYMEGGYGNDTYVFAKGHGQDTIYDTEGADTIQFTDVDFSEVKFRKNSHDLIIYGYNDNDSVLIQNFFYNDEYTIENFVFKDKTVTLAQLRKDGMQLYGTSGNDSISITNGRVLVYGDDGNDTITTGSGNDVLDGGAGNDKLYGNAGNDTLIGGSGNDYMEGGYGNDTYVFAKGHGKDTIYDTEGADTIQFTDVDFSEVKFRKNSHDLIIYGYNDNDSVLIQNFFYNDEYTIENFVFKDKTVTLAQLRKDGMQLYGTSGNDSISITNGRVLVYGDDGNDTITTGSGNDVLDGGAGNDKLYGNAGNDTLIGGSGNDYMEGGYGNDTYVFAKGHGQDTIYDTEGADTIQFTDVDFAEVKFRKNSYDLIIYGYNDNDSVLIQDFFYRDSYTIENFVFKDKTVTLDELCKIVITQ